MDITWATNLPLKITVARESKDPSRPSDQKIYYTSTKLLSFLPVTVNQTRQFFNREKETPVWFSYQGSAIRWHLPVGLLLDLYNVSTDVWPIEVNFSPVPPEIEDLSMSLLESSFCMSLKEADQIRSRSERINLFQKQDFKRLWNAIQNSSLEEWRSVANQLLRSKNGDFKIPVKFHYDNTYFQNPTEVEDTVQAALEKALAGHQFSPENFKVVLLGTELAADMPLRELSDFSYPDTFLHLVLQRA
ncbi:Oidioi.mRNA.OKI2018_I69.chr1.g2506.t1.cds [Oikopleura dioica]|uniref:Autophagy protein 5 n=1 Tax=Oikopleura dioica TaxID=34765 RepID=A0ABN7ST20_OIKDI|nr:Oidioi.mRNA.OKI2018_I69.chr1.g2506.t1.cds [Oikopleura dioica]